MMKKKEETVDAVVELVDLAAISAKPIAVSVDGMQLPLKIGSKIVLGDDNEVVRTVVGIKVDVEGHATYCLEWFNGTDFKYDWVSANELHYIYMNVKKKNPIGLAK